MRILHLIILFFLIALPPESAGYEESRTNQKTENVYKFLNIQSSQSNQLFKSKDSSIKACCKICKKGKACGDSCISKKYICRKPPGCACDG